MKTNYQGIDYRMGGTNIDSKTGIRFGVINQNEVLQAWADESEPFHIPTCPECGNELKDGFDSEKCEHCGIKIDPDLDFDMQEPLCWIIDNNEYQAESDDYGDIFITKSPYYTTCQFCSPCAPGAGYIMNTIENGVKAFCFEHDFFDDGIAPYPVFSVETGELVEPTN